MSSGAWQQKPDHSDFTSHHALYKEAVAAKLWIYRTDKKVWFTPEEFRAAFIEQKPEEQMSAIIGFFKIMDPQVGIKQRLDFMKKTSEEIEAFTRRVVAYYNGFGRLRR